MFLAGQNYFINFKEIVSFLIVKNRSQPFDNHRIIVYLHNKKYEHGENRFY